MADEPTLPERRRTPRVPLGAAVECAIKVQSRVSILDVSLTGMLLATEVALPPGTRVHLRTFLGGSGFAADVEVQRTTRRKRGPAESGVTFIRMDGQSHRSLEQFLRRASD